MVPWKMTPTPDSNVRLARGPRAANARRARRSALARLLLETGVKLLLFAVASSMSACIIPVGPEFQDPPGAPNASPEIVDPDPLWGAEVTTTAQMGQAFQIAVTDPNDQLLHIRWIVDNQTRAGDPGPSMVEPSEYGMRFSKLVTCNDVDTRLSRHPVTAIVADQQFELNDSNLYHVQNQGLSDKITWTLNLTCLSSSP